MLLAGGELVTEDFDPNIARMGTGWAGGVAHAGELCGAIAGAVMLIGLKHGRVTLDDSDTKALSLVTKFRKRFEADLGFTQCRDFTGGRFNPENHRRCAAVVRHAMEIALDMLDVA
jgi:C_GCAxxG_C_C family probable redox protein